MKPNKNIHDDRRQRQLMELEEKQRQEAPHPKLIFHRQVGRIRIPPEGQLPQSEALLARLYSEDFIVREKKPLVVDTRRSWGPFMASVDEKPLVVLDACSQIATLTHGFAHPGMMRELYDGSFDSCLWSNPDTTVQTSPELDAYAQSLRKVAPPSLEHISFVCAGGAEANEKALRIARLHAPRNNDGSVGKRVLAFECGFHGRTFASLMATWNPAKRGPFELSGYQAIFCKPNLADVKEVLAHQGSQIYAILIESMMAEGGDIYLAKEFLLGLCRLSKQAKIPLIVDEVQTGFSTGGKFFWWQRLGLDQAGEDAIPDIITCAKKANLGIVISRWPDPEQNQVNVVSAVRGRIHLESADDQNVYEEILQTQLTELAQAFPELVLNPRVAGVSFAFELPTAELQQAFIAQRFYQGFITYGAGDKTIRFRINASWTETTVRELFARITRTLQLLNQPEAQIWHSEGFAPTESTDERYANVIVREVRETDWSEIMKIEKNSYEPARQDSEAYLRRALLPGGVGLVVCDRQSEQILGFCFGGPIEYYQDIAGPDQDSRQGHNETFYSADVTVAKAHRGRGLGRLLKQSQLQWVKDHGFKYLSGRTRVGAADHMAELNLSFGAYKVAHLYHQYEGNAEAEYYYIPLCPPLSDTAEPNETKEFSGDYASGIQQPFGSKPAFMASRELVGPLTSRLNLSNYATIDMVHYCEHLRLIRPRGTHHMYVTSSRDEMIDKALRCIRLSRPKAEIAIGVEGGYVGHVTAAARSLSDPRGFGPEFGLFAWPKIPHPCANLDASLQSLHAIVSQWSAEQIFALVIEWVGERSGLSLSDEAAKRLASACKELDIPLVIVETASGGYRNGQGPWAIDQAPTEVVPDMVLWYPGGQIGHIFVNDRYWIDKPLTLMSTWDGDEISAIRAHEHLRAAYKLTSLRTAIETLSTIIHDTSKRFSHVQSGGLGLYRSFHFHSNDVAQKVYQACKQRGLTLGRGLPGTLLLVPPLSVTEADLQAMQGLLWEALAAV